VGLDDGSEVDETHIQTLPPNDLTSTSDQSKKRRTEDILTLSDDESTFHRSLVVASTEEQPINLSMFGIQKLLSCAVGNIKSAKSCVTDHF
jgi:hypothetical protein